MLDSDVSLVHLQEQSETLPFALIYVPNFGKNILQTFGTEIIFVDATYSVSKYNLALYLITVKTSLYITYKLSNCFIYLDFGYKIAAFFYTGRDHFDAISTCLRLIKISTNFNGPVYSMTDNQRSLINALTSIFSCEPLTCTFHEMQAMDRFLSNQRNGVPLQQRAFILNLFQVIFIHIFNVTEKYK